MIVGISIAAVVVVVLAGLSHAPPSLGHDTDDLLYKTLASPAWYEKCCRCHLCEVVGREVYAAFPAETPHSLMGRSHDACGLGEPQTTCYPVLAGSVLCLYWRRRKRTSLVPEVEAEKTNAECGDSGKETDSSANSFHDAVPAMTLRDSYGAHAASRVSKAVAVHTSFHWMVMSEVDFLLPIEKTFSYAFDAASPNVLQVVACSMRPLR